ncbi:unnamed protein product [Diatraea saccharalis]|uniref:Uncharacterized protein n=1 Tax=Diatraea saccharalis TaxID=40085 RepID=A0A9N9WGR2_9NEOP|nr:unnamed protein product [Diatraea saccharalis]
MKGLVLPLQALKYAIYWRILSFTFDTSTSIRADTDVDTGVRCLWALYGEKRDFSRRHKIVFLFAFHVTTGTLDIEKIKGLKSTAAEKLQTLTAKAATGLQQLKETASNSLHELAETASHNIQHLGDDIDLNNLYKLDVLHVIPAVKSKYKLIKDLYNKPETKVNVIHIYGDELNSHFDHAKLVKVKEWHPALPHHVHEPPHHFHHSPHHPPHHHHHLEHYHLRYPVKEY